MKKILSLITGLTLLLVHPIAFADDFEPADIEENASNNFILDADNTGGDIILQFGDILSESLKWDSINLNFQLSDSLNLGQSEIKEVAFENLTNAPISPVTGQIYHNTTDTNTYIWNGSEWEDITSTNGTAEYFDAYDSVGATNISAGYTDIPLGTQRKATSDFTHIAGSAEVTINTTSTYLVSYSVSTGISSGTSRSESESRLMIDTGSGYNIVPGSIGRMYNRTLAQSESTASRSFALDLNSGNKLKIQASRISGTSTITTLAEGSALVITRLEGIPTSGIGHVQNTDTGTTENIFTLDKDNTGGNITLKFGELLNETLFWDSSNNSFNLSDDLNVANTITSQGFDVHLASVIDTYDNSGLQAITTTKSVLNIDTVRINDGIYSLNTDTITFSQNGLYRITARVSADSLDTSGGIRATATLKVEEDKGSGFSDVPGALCSDYMRENSTSNTALSCSITYIGSYNNTDSIRLTVQSDNSTTMQTTPGGSALTVELIRTE